VKTPKYINVGRRLNLDPTLGGDFAELAAGRDFDRDARLSQRFPCIAIDRGNYASPTPGFDSTA
jgi:hypothetical protein